MYLSISKLLSLSGHSSIKLFRTKISKLSTLKIVISLSRFGSNMSWNSDAGWWKRVNEILDLMPSAVSTESGSTQRQSTQSVRLELMSECFWCVKVIIQICSAFKLFNTTLLLGNWSRKLISFCSLVNDFVLSASVNSPTNVSFSYNLFSLQYLFFHKPKTN